MPILLLESGPDKGKDYSVLPNMILGRKSTCSVALDDVWASREHTRIFQEGAVYYVEDLNSSNGTYLNEKRISKSPLNFGDRIRIGETVLLFTKDIIEDLDRMSVAEASERAKGGARPLPLQTARRTTSRRDTLAERPLQRKSKKPRSPIRTFFSLLLFLAFLIILFLGSWFLTRIVLDITGK